MLRALDHAGYRLMRHNTATHTFMTLDDLADLARQDIEFAIYETESGKDISTSV